MMSRRSGVGLAVVNGQLYAVGGFDGTTYLKTIEVFDQVYKRDLNSNQFNSGLFRKFLGYNNFYN